ncbi:MAG: restriction endonuclease [Xanthobacteraceae bacterium]|nr:restriction endonuclease [Xanthobacteraceae bacterium]
MDRPIRYRRDPVAELDSVRALTPEERGVYFTVIELIHVHGGAVEDDERFLADWCNCDVRVWRRIRARLIEFEQLYELDGTLRNERADDEAAATLARRAAARAAGRASGLSRAAGSSEINELAPTPVREDDAADPVPPIARARAEARAQIKAHLQGLDPYEMQELSAALLQAMGYVTTVSPPGPDGGTDILALPDALGAGTPHIRVQVKHRTAPAGREEIAALRGILDPAREAGLFVSTGGFSRHAEEEVRRPGAPVTLIDEDDFIALWVRHQEGVPEAARDRLSMSPVHFLDPARMCRGARHDRNRCGSAAPPGVLSERGTGVSA